MRKKTVLTFLLLWAVMINTGLADVTTQLDYALRCKQNSDLEQAEAIYQDIITNNPGSDAALEALIGRARMYKKNKRYSEAESIYLDILTNHSSSPVAVEAREHLTILYLAMGQSNSEQSSLQRLKEDFTANPDLPKAIHHIAKLYERAGRGQDANDLFEIILQQHPDNFYAGNIRFAGRKAQIESYFESGDESSIQSAINSLKSDFAGHEFLPDGLMWSAEQYQSKGYRLIDDGQINEGTACLQKALAICEEVKTGYPDSIARPDAYDLAGGCYRKLGDLQNSITNFRAVVDNYPRYKLAWNCLFMTGRNYEQMGKEGLITVTQAETEVRAVYEELIENYPGCKAIGAAQGWLDQQK